MMIFNQKSEIKTDTKTMGTVSGGKDCNCSLNRK